MYTCTCIHTHIQEFEAARKRSEGVLEAFSVDQLYLQEDEWPGIFLFLLKIYICIFFFEEPRSTRGVFRRPALPPRGRVAWYFSFFY